MATVLKHSSSRASPVSATPLPTLRRICRDGSDAHRLLQAVRAGMQNPEGDASTVDNNIVEEFKQLQVGT